MSETRKTCVVVNGDTIRREVAVDQHLVDFLREDLGLTGSHLGCEHGVCGACQVLVDGEVVARLPDAGRADRWQARRHDRGPVR
jgi:carbon-monoxide dehydrogenase small subunit